MTRRIFTTLALAALGAAVGCSDDRALNQAAPPAPPPLTITRVNPVNGPTAGGTTVTILGTKFIDGVTQVDSVMFWTTASSALGSSVTVLSPSQLTVQTPALATGPYDVIVTNSTTTETVTALNGFTFFDVAPPAPTIATVSPSSGPVAGGVTITITGSAFVPGMTVTIGGTAVTPANVNVTSGGVAVVVVPAGSGPGAVNVVVNNGGGTTTLVGGFVYTAASGNPAPGITAVNPNTGSILGGDLITITGSNFVSTPTSKPTVQFGTGTASNVTVSHAGELTCVTPSGPAGAVTVRVVNPDGQSVTLASGFTYITPSPSISGISPSNGPQTIAHSVTITGQNFFPGITVTFGGVSGTVTFRTLNQIVVTTPTTAGSGAVTVVVTNVNGTPPSASTSYTFNPPPTFTSVNPTSGSTAGGTAFTIVGTGFLGTPWVQFAGQFASVSSATSTQIIGSTPGSASPSTVNIVITNPDNQSVTAASAYTYVPSPSITTVNPNVGPLAGGGSCTITGGNFQSGATVQFGTNSATVTSVTATQIVVTIPAGSALGSVGVTVTNPTPAPPNNTTTLANGYAYSNAPVVTAVTTLASPAACDTAGNNPGTTNPCSITITGNTFLAGATVALEAGSGGSLVACTGLSITPTQITCTAPSSGIVLTGATIPVRVTNPGNLFDNSKTIKVVYDVNFQTRQYTFDTSAGIDCRRRWYIDCSAPSFAKDLQNRALQTWGTPGDSTAPPSPLTATDLYAIDWMRAYILSTLNITYGRNANGTKVSGTSKNVTFVALPPATGNPGCASAATDWSRHGVSGCNPSEGGTTHPKASQTGTGCQGGTVGTAAFDAGNPCGDSAEINTNSCYHTPLASPCSGSRGTFMSGIGNLWGNSLSPRLTTADQTYLDGTTTTGARYTAIHNLLQQFAHRVAFVTSHECGHSHGLVANTAGAGSCNNGGGQCGSSGSHNNCCTTNIMRSVVSFGGSMTATSFTFSTGGSCASPSTLNSWAMLSTFLGISP